MHKAICIVECVSIYTLLHLWKTTKALFLAKTFFWIFWIFDHKSFWTPKHNLTKRILGQKKLSDPKKRINFVWQIFLKNIFWQKQNLSKSFLTNYFLWPQFCVWTLKSLKPTIFEEFGAPRLWDPKSNRNRNISEKNCKCLDYIEESHYHIIIKKVCRCYFLQWFLLYIIHINYFKFKNVFHTNYWHTF